ncbi:hypothetical protein BSLG_009795 [Batrachochytrium salamandrivorans]|nr:hypothetical protein BSLG_009795 [Batrachochytrium salamandrivorans]
MDPHAAHPSKRKMPLATMVQRKLSDMWESQPPYLEMRVFLPAPTILVVSRILAKASETLTLRQRQTEMVKRVAIWGVTIENNDRNSNDEKKIDMDSYNPESDDDISSGGVQPQDYSQMANLSLSDAVILPILESIPLHTSHTTPSGNLINSHARLSSQLDLVRQLSLDPSLDLLSEIIRQNSPKSLNQNLLCDFLMEQDSKYLVTVVPFICSLALELPDLFPVGLAKLSQNMNRVITLTQRQIASLLACAFLCLYDDFQRNKVDPRVNFYWLYSNTGRRSETRMVKINFLMHYFERVRTRQDESGNVTFHRKALSTAMTPDWRTQHRTKLCNVGLRLEPIEDILGTSQADFSNKYIGGGVLSSGAVQEEIMFLIMPELIAACIFTEVLQDNESLHMIGAERYSDYSGYADTLQWAGSHIDVLSRDERGRKKRDIFAMDAIKFSYHMGRRQFDRECVLRDLTKAYTAFLGSSESCLSTAAHISTGCGAFAGNLELKSLIQVMAASVAGRDLIYSPFSETQFAQDLLVLLDQLRLSDVSVARLYKLICDFRQHAFGDYRSTKKSLFEYIRRVLRGS